MSDEPEESPGLDDFADIFWEEWKRVEAERLEIVTDLLAVCRAMHDISVKLNENMLQVLIENAWKESGVTKHLAAATVSIIKALTGLDRKNSAEAVFLENTNPDREFPTWDFQNGTA